MPQDKQTNDKNLYLWLLLTLTPKVGPVTALRLLHHFGTIENIYQQSQSTLAQIVNNAIAELICKRVSTEAANAALGWVKQNSINHIISLEHPLYPKELAQISDPPPVLYLKGNLDLLTRNKFAIVGTRHPTEVGKTNAFNFALDLTKHNLTIVSGLALGIDRAAHLGAISKGGSTIGVLGTGIDAIYPNSNKDLFAQVLSRNGLLVSEFPLNTPPLVNNFPRRNRIIAGLSLGLLVVESAIDGGSMISANIALEINREVMAIPGPINNPATRGCHKLIKNGAKLVDNINDILEELNIKSTHITYNSPCNVDPILEYMGYEPVTIEKLSTGLKIEFADLCANLLELELSGKITNCGGGRYLRIL